jgi:hypothetical protein
MILVTNPAFDLETMGHVLEATRQVAGKCLVGVGEPIAAQVRADVIHLKSETHSTRWNNRLVGCQVENIKQAKAALAAGCSYLVAPNTQDSFIAEMAGLEEIHPHLVWFVSQCQTLADLETATSLGARRVWMDSELDIAVRVWANHLRRVSRPERRAVAAELGDSFPWMHRHDT